MRIDKFLWAVRLFKTRSLATEACTNGRVFITDKAVKASKEIKIDDCFCVKNHGVKFSYKVLDIPPSRVGASLLVKYLLDTTSEEEKLKLLAQKQPSAFVYRERGTGRPTKKDRRIIEVFHTELGSENEN